jgi:penicillin-insensitive murein endopeptidase
MSRQGGGPLQGHLSHASGRDADLRLYGIDDAGRPIAGRNVEYGPDGRARDGGPERLDLARSWALVEALVTSRRARVQFLFLHESLERLLVAYGRDHAPRAVVARAARVLQPAGDPRRTAPHDDHLHLRIVCGRVDVAAGCADRAPRPVRRAAFGKDSVSGSRRRGAGRTSPG